MYDGVPLVFALDLETGKPRFTDTFIAELAGKNRKAIGKLSYSQETERAIIEVLPLLHREAALFTYEPRLFSALRSLREIEEQARELLNDLREDATGEEIANTFELAIGRVAAPFHEAIEAAMRIRFVSDTRELTSEERTTVYFAASILFTMVLIWEKSADLMFRLKVGREPLDFLPIGIDRVSTAPETLALANELYGIVQSELLELAKRYRAVSNQPEAYRGIDRDLQLADMERFKLARQDSEIAGLQMVSIGSHAEDWLRADPAYVGLSGQTYEDVRDLLGVPAMNLNSGLSLAVGLLKRMPDNARLARNLAYFAIQGSHEAVLKTAAAQLSRLCEVPAKELWALSILGRKPLADEPHLKKLFTGGQPTIWKE